MSQAFVFESTSLSWSSMWEHHVNASSAIAVWKRPHADKRYFLVDSSGGSPVENLDLPHFSPGFLVAPFIGKPLFFQAEKIFISEVPEKKVHALTGFQPFAHSPKRADFEYWVQASIQQIKQGNFQKVVLSRTDEAPLPADFSVISAFESLCVEYPNAFVCAVYEPVSQQTWLCATPEILVSQDADGIFKTISLAGTQSAILPDGHVISSQDARWSQKEIEEQAFVSRYIIECFKKIRLREYIENGPKTIKAGNLLHLKTEYWVDTKALNYASLPGVMLELLHPTSAVCGTPKEAAIAWIAQAEKHERGFYSGYLGPVNVDHEIHLFVNLRTVKIQKVAEGYAATYYAGCGITEDSDPEKQVDEQTYILSGRHEIDYLNEKYEWNLPEGDYETLGGMLISIYEDIPEANEMITLAPFQFQIVSVVDAKIDTVKVTITGKINPKEDLSAKSKH